MAKQSQPKKGPTPKAPQNAPPPEQTEQVVPPSTVIVTTATNFSTGIARDTPYGDLLDLVYSLPGNGQCVIRVPPEAGREIAVAILQTCDAFDAAPRTTAGGVHLPDGSDVELEAKMHADMKAASAAQGHRK